MGSGQRSVRRLAFRLWDDRFLQSSPLLIAVPLAVGVAVFITEMSPTWLRGPLAFTTELLAAIPSVIYGLWAIFVLVPYCATYVVPSLATLFRLDGTV